jgi:hypothetical protein
MRHDLAVAKNVEIPLERRRIELRAQGKQRHHRLGDVFSFRRDDRLDTIAGGDHGRAADIRDRSERGEQRRRFLLRNAQPLPNVDRGSPMIDSDQY